MTVDGGTYDFDVALSFAGEDRALVQDVAHQLRERGLRPFYDEDFSTQMWGEDLYVYLDDVYRKRARFTVIFVSRHYVAKPWTNHERMSAQARALESADAYVLPVRLDDSTLPGLRPTVGYLDAQRMSVHGLADAIAAKCGQPAVSRTEEVPERVPRTKEELRRLIEERPPAWEYFLYAATLFEKQRDLDPKYHDHEVRFAARTGRVVRGEEAFRYLSDRFSEVQLLTSRVNSLLSPAAQERAFGLPGVPGDVDRIVHLASRLVSTYEDLLDWAAELRGTSVPAVFREVFDLGAQTVDRPIEEMRQFFSEFIRTTDALRARMSKEETVVVNLSLILTHDEALSKRLDKAMKRAGRRL